MKGRPLNSKGYEGPQLTEADEELGRRRYLDYVKRTKGLAPYSYDAEDVIKLLPRDGGTPFLCGDTRFDHLMDDKCHAPEKADPENYQRCEREMKNHKLCYRKIGHPNQHMSQDYWERNARLKREARRRKNASSRGKTTAGAVD